MSTPAKPEWMEFKSLDNLEQRGAKARLANQTAPSKTSDTITKLPADGEAFLKTITDHYADDLRETPFRDSITPEKDVGASVSTQSKKNSFPLNSYQWYTSDYPRIFVYDYYNKIASITQDYVAPKPAGTGILGAISSAATAIVDNATSYVDTVSNDIKNIAKSLGIIDSNTQKTITTDFNKYLQSFPKIKAYEIKVNDNLTILLNVLMKGLQMVSDISQYASYDNSNNTADKIKNSTNIFLNTVGANFKTMWKGITGHEDFASSYTPENRIKFAVIIYRSLISGTYTAYYELPFMNDESRNYLSSDGNSGWKSENLGTALDGVIPFINQIKSFASKFMEGGIDIASRPKWNSSSVTNYQPIKTNFTLFNDTYEHFEQNLKFIHTFVAGNLWVQDVLVQRSSSLYDVEIPGRTRQCFCSANVSVKYSGKVRINDKIFAGSGDMISLDDVVNGKLLLQPHMDLKNRDLLRYIPDAFEVDVEFHSLVPNNFNTYMSYVSFNDVIPSVGGTISSIEQKIADNIAATDKINQSRYDRVDDRAGQQAV